MPFCYTFLRFLHRTEKIFFIQMNGDSELETFDTAAWCNRMVALISQTQKQDVTSCPTIRNLKKYILGFHTLHQHKFLKYEIFQIF